MAQKMDQTKALQIVSAISNENIIEESKFLFKVEDFCENKIVSSKIKLLSLDAEW